jgi:hypothetical protein
LVPWAHLLKGLHADAEARQAQIHVLAQPAGVKSARVRFHGDLGSCRNAKPPVQRPQDLLMLHMHMHMHAQQIPI